VDVIRRLRKTWRAIALALALLLAQAAGAQTFTRIFFFGDSITDTGILRPAYIPLDLVGTWGYDPDRWTNDGGAVWAEGFAAALGHSATSRVDGGTNYATGGARTDELAAQINWFKADHGTADASALYVIWAGGNDLLQGYGTSHAVNGVISAINQLNGLGAKKFLVANFYDLGPLAPGTGPLGPLVPIPAGASQWVSAYATELSVALATLSGVTLYEFDAKALFDPIVSDPAAHGFSAGLGLCVDDPSCVAGIGVDDHLMFDHVHLTSAGHDLLAQGALRVVPPPSAPAPTCVDGTKNGRETDVDCGGAASCECPAETPWWACYFAGVQSCLDRACPACEEGRACKSGGDCRSHVCRASNRLACLAFRSCGGDCAAPSCTDHVQNGDETDRDCGGSCPPCRTAQRCEGDPDCDSRVCEDETCLEPSCHDDAQNGGETGFNCGGPCQPCSCETRGRCIMFVTSTAQSGDMGGLASADAICNQLSAAAGLVGTYQAWLCDGKSWPAMRSSKASVPYLRTDGALIAINWADLTDGSIVNGISRTETGQDVSATAPFLPWTNVTAAGTCDDQRYRSPGFGPCQGLPLFEECPTNCADDGALNGWTSSSPWAQGTKGDVNGLGSLWTDSVTGLCSEPQERIYCIEQ
jgi:phospholipase/lecithinase/hemolysin